MDRSILNQTAALISGANLEFSDFEPGLAVIITWDGVAVYGSLTRVS